MKKNLKEYIAESILDPIKKGLSKDLWENGKLKKSAKTFIIKKIETWFSTYTNKKIKDAYILGSMAGFQYSDEADIDANIVIDLSDERLKEIRKFIPNGQNLPGTKHPVNYYIVNKPSIEWKKDPLYDILKEKWIRKPTKDDGSSVIANYKAVIEIARFFIAGIDSAISEYNSDVAAYDTYKNYLDYSEDKKDKKDIEDLNKIINFKLQEIIADLDGIKIAKHMLMSLRKEAFEKNEGFEIGTSIYYKSPDTSINNLIYKYVERLGYFEKIKKILNTKEEWENKLNKI